MNGINVVVNDGYVRNYFFKKRSDNTIKLIVNTYERWTNVHRYSENQLEIGDGEDDDCIGHLLELDPRFVDMMDDGINRTPYKLHEKDQVIFMFLTNDFLAVE